MMSKGGGQMIRQPDGREWYSGCDTVNLQERWEPKPRLDLHDGDWFRQQGEREARKATRTVMIPILIAVVAVAMLVLGV